MTRQLTRQLTRGLTRGLSGISRTISGFAYPGETLTSTVAGQWFVDDVAVVGETGATYVVNLLDIGKPIRCANSNELTCWKPQDIAGVAAFWWSRSGVLTSIDPDTMATDGQTVRRWADRTTPPFNANQTVGESQPFYRATGQSSGPSLELDGSNDFLEINNVSAFRNVEQGYMFAGCRDTNRDGGAASHFAIGYSIGTGTGVRLGVATRFSGSNFTAIARRIDSDALTSASTASNENYNVITAHGDFSNGFVRLRVNGSVSASTALSGSGTTSDTDSQSAAIGDSRIGANLNFPGHITSIIVVNQSLSATDLSRIERFIGLQGGLNIPLV
jgi:hypothetical protein